MLELVAASVMLAQSPSGPVCAPYAEAVAYLEERFQETPVFQGISHRCVLVQVYQSSHGSWTALITTPDGRACIADHGDAGERLTPAAVGEPA